MVKQLRAQAELLPVESPPWRCSRADGEGEAAWWGWVESKHPYRQALLAQGRLQMCSGDSCSSHVRLHLLCQRKSIGADVSWRQQLRALLLLIHSDSMAT